MSEIISDYRSHEIFDNPYQGSYHRALFVCSGGILRSATAAHWAAEHKGWNTRSCGIYNASVVQLSATLVKWAQRIYCMEEKHYDVLADIYGQPANRLSLMNIPDNFSYRDPELIKLIAAALERFP